MTFTAAIFTIAKEWKKKQMPQNKEMWFFLNESSIYPYDGTLHRY